MYKVLSEASTMTPRRLLKFALATLAVLGALASLVTALPLLFSRTASVSAEVTPSRFVIPPGIDGQIKSLHSLAQREVLQKELKMGFLDGMGLATALKQGAKDEAIDTVNLYLEMNLPRELSEPFNSLHGFWPASVRNTGERTARSVSVKIPNTLYACQQREGEEPKCDRASDVIKVGDLQPEESVAILAWTRDEPSRLGEEDVRVTFSEGVGSVSILAPVGPFWQWMDRYSRAFLLSLVPLGIFLLVSIVAYLIDGPRNSAIQKVVKGGEDDATESPK